MSDTDTDTDLLGDKGETHFKSVCLNVGLRVVSRKPDIEGIDKRVVWIRPGTMALAEGETYDTAKGHRRINVQVKTTEKKNGIVDIKLSAAKRLVDLNEPGYIVIIKYDEDNNPTLSFLHIKGKLIDRILKALRRCHLKDKNPRLAQT